MGSKKHGKWLKDGQWLESPYTGKRYVVGDLIGAGGFGQAYSAVEVDRSGRQIKEVCIKVTQDQASWHRESYFGEALAECPRVIQLYESFPLERRMGGIKATFYYLVSELAINGTIRDFLEAMGKPWHPTRAKGEVVELLKVLTQLHAGGVTHRDLTPMNIFVTEGFKLKLGDFGVAAQTLYGKRPRIMAFNPYFVTAGFSGTPPDDVFQMGQVLAALLLGNAESILTVTEAKRRLICDAALKNVVIRAIGPKQDRYHDAYEMMQALKGEQEAFSKIKSLKSKTVVFTGPLSIKRNDAILLVLQAGGMVASKVNGQTNVLVVGGRGDYHGGGNKGVKIRAALRINKKAPNKITLIGEPGFMRLVRK
jgi:serine/threonine protein kinase